MNPGFDEKTIAKWKTDGVLYNLNTRTNMQMPLYYQLYEDFKANEKRFNVGLAASELEQPLLLIHGDQDPVVPVSRAYELKEKQPAAELFIMEGANHTFGGSHPFTCSGLPAAMLQAASKTVAFFRKNLRHD